jgi:mitochondrial splicing suppressor protein 51
METTFTCLRCVRAISGQNTSRTSSKLAQVAAGARKLSSKSRQSPPSRSILTKIEKDAFRERPRAASTAAAPAEREDNFERAFQLPNYQEYGEYRPGIRLSQDDLFHPFSKSPVPEMRQRALYTRNHAYCPHPLHKQMRIPASPDDPEARKSTESEAIPPAHVSFECPDCGIATYCCEDHWASDFENHLEICDTLRQINEDDHDLRSGRYFAEFEYPGPQLDEILVNMTNWDTLLYTRQFEAINEDRAMRQATRLLTYPVTVASVLHELSPYSIRRGGRLTTEGLKSLSGKVKKQLTVEC